MAYSDLFPKLATGKGMLFKFVHCMSNFYFNLITNGVGNEKIMNRFHIMLGLFLT